MTDVYANFEPEESPMLDFDLELGATLSGDMEIKVTRLAGEIKALDAWVETVADRTPATMYKAWKLWSKGTIDGIMTMLKKSAAEAVLPVWPVSAVAAALVPGKVTGINDAFVAGEYEKLQAWRVTFRAAGLAIPGMPAPSGTTPSTAIVPTVQPEGAPEPQKPGSDGFLDMLGKGALIIGGGAVAVLLISKLMERRSRSVEAQSAIQAG